MRAGSGKSHNLLRWGTTGYKVDLQDNLPPDTSLGVKMSGYNASIPITDLIPGFTGTFDDAVQIIWVSNYVSVVSLALVAYDTIITMEQEIRLVWRGRWGLPSILYILTRYGTVIQAAVTTVTSTDWNVDMSTCLRLNLFSQWTIPLVMVIVEATLAMRVVALYENRRSMAVGLWTWYLANAGVMLAMMGLSLEGTYGVPSLAPPTLGCELGGTLSFYWELYVPSLVFETTVAALTLFRALQHKRLLSTIPLLHVLVRDGFFYFFIVFALMLLNLVISLTANVLYLGWTPQISICLASVIAVRLFLNLREVAYNAEGATISSSGLFEMSPRATTGTERSTTTWSAVERGPAPYE